MSNIVKILKTTLKAPLTPTALSISLKDFIDSKENAVALSDFGDFGVVVISQGSKIEMIKFTGVTQNADDTATLTVPTDGRHIDPTSPYATGATGLSFLAGAEVIVTNDPLTMSIFARTDNANSWDEIQTFSATEIPIYDTHPTFTDDKHLIDKKYADDLAIAGAPDSTIAVKGISLMSVAPVLSTSPIAVGDNDTRMPTQDESDAFVGSSGTAISALNVFVDEDDVSNAGVSDKIVRATGTSLPALDGSSLLGIGNSSIPVVKDITLGEAMTIGDNQSDGGILIDSTTEITAFGGGSVIVGSNTNRGLVVFVQITGTSANDAITGVTYDSVAMTAIGNANTSVVNGYTQKVYSFYLNDPNTGTNTLSVLQSGSQSTHVFAYSIYNVKQTAQPEAHTEEAYTSGSATTASITTIASGAHVFGSSANQALGNTVDSGNAIYGGVIGATDTWAYNSATMLPATVISTATFSTSLGTVLLSLAPVTAPAKGVFPSKASTSTYSQYQNGYEDFVGFATETISAGSNAIIKHTGVMAGFTGLTVGDRYYLSDTTGEISNSVGTNTKKVGLAISSTELLIINN